MRDFPGRIHYQRFPTFRHSDSTGPIMIGNYDGPHRFHWKYFLPKYPCVARRLW